MITKVGILLLMLFVVPSSAFAAGKARAAREATEYVLRKFGRPAADEGVDNLARQAERLLATHGDEGLLAFRKIGPRTLRYVEEAGQNGPQAIKLMCRQGDDAIWVVAKPDRMAMFVKYGDDAADALIKHKGIADPLIESLQAPAARALKALDGQRARRLAVMFDEGSLAKIGRSPELLDVIGKYGDRGMDFVWRNKGALATTAVLAAFLADPKPFIDGVEDLASRIKHVVGPVAAEAARRFPWEFVIILGLVALAALVEHKTKLVRHLWGKWRHSQTATMKLRR